MALGRMAPAMESGLTSWLAAKARSWRLGLALDYRSLALMRMAYGLVLLIDVILRWGDLEAHYSDWGCQPGAQVLEQGWAVGYWSWHLIQGHWLGQCLLFGLNALAALALMVGFRTRWSGPLAWLFLVSLQNRNPMILDGGDLYLRCLTFWLLWTPWGECWSWDVPRTQARRCWNWGARGYCWQLTLIYSFAYWLKTGREWTVDGTATQYALMLDSIVTPAGLWLRNQSEWLRPLTVAVLNFEGLVPWLLWIHPATRVVALLGLMALHFGLACFLHLGIFALAAGCSGLALIPSAVWDSWSWTSQSRASQPDPSRESWWRKGLLVFLLLRVSQWNFATERGGTPDWAGDLRLLRLDQQWNMFAPKPLSEDGYFVCVGETRKGEWVDLWIRSPLPPQIQWEKPERITDLFPNARWRKLMTNLQYPNHRGWARPLLQYLQRRWERAHSEQPLRSCRLYFVAEATLPQGQEGPLEVRLVEYLSMVAPGQEETAARATLATGLELLETLHQAALTTPERAVTP